MAAEYEALAPVYEWLVPDALLEPEGAASAFDAVLEAIPPGGRVLDCASGTGQLAVGLAIRGYDVVATDISPRMVERTQALARERQVDVHAEVRSWADLGRLEPNAFDAVFCTGNSLTHAAATTARRAALASMHARLRPGGVLAVTSRNWRMVREAGSRLELPGGLVSRCGIEGIVVYAWTIADRWDLPHTVDVGVGLLNGAAVAPSVARLTFWPFTEQDLQDDLEVSGFLPSTSTYTPSVERYLVTATRA